MATWDEEGPHARFWSRLLNENVDALVQDPDKQLLKHMRYDNKMVKTYQARFGKIFEERGLNLYQLIAEAHGDSGWDAEDEEKHAGVAREKKEVPVNQRKDDNVVAAREAGARERQHELQGKPEAGVRLVEEEEGRKGRKGRGESFYRLAGGITKG